MPDFARKNACAPLRLHRRSVLAGMAMSCCSPHGIGTAHGGSQEIGYSWQDWTRSFLMPEGRVVDPQQGGISHSEGQAYGLLLAQAFGDESAFRLIEQWTSSHLAIRQDRLLAWKWMPDPQDGTALDWRNATDGDLIRAWALLRATRDSGWGGYETTFRAIAQDIASICLAPDPRAPAERLLVPGAEARRQSDRVLVNPSYFIPRALRELGEAADEPVLVRCADHSETVLAEMAATGFLADWIDVTANGFEAPQEHDFRWGYDALRIPLYLVWSGQVSHPAVMLAQKMMLTAPIPDHVAVVIGPDGQVEAMSDEAGFRLIADLASCTPSDARKRSTGGGSAPYYPATLCLLAQIAMRESGCAAPDAQQKP
ncbi:glycosyl hydrolase family 8 [Paracoccus sp. MBLB3053]|uniref:cellulase n=1 Tax=Paracoccus aurantius TaxID=3073814 RepID=A0ABU2HYA2_9RHOB|nr:glycosyl hydrolase family 8 [Paracoccus sp. MBLB3053]MDS9470020.1 glycosyl hydrolase family 8 [Paracoccus sp. MBLB3053]